MTMTMMMTAATVMMTAASDLGGSPIGTPPLAPQTRWWNLWDGVFVASCPHGNLVDWNAYLMAPLCGLCPGIDR